MRIGRIFILIFACFLIFNFNIFAENSEPKKENTGIDISLISEKDEQEMIGNLDLLENYEVILQLDFFENYNSYVNENNNTVVDGE